MEPDGLNRQWEHCGPSVVNRGGLGSNEPGNVFDWIAGECDRGVTQIQFGRKRNLTREVCGRVVLAVFGDCGEPRDSQHQ